MPTSSTSAELPVVFACQGQSLVGIIHQTAAPAALGVLIVVGGPQYRVGSHRQFILLARHLAECGVPAMRFDVRGMGDSEGEPRRFDGIDDDIRAAIDAFFTACPALSQVVLWGLCDGASAALFYAYQDRRVKGLALLNPWLSTEQGAAKTYLKHYYRKRLLSPDFWRKLLTFRFNYAASLTSLWTQWRQATGAKKQPGKVDAGLALPIRLRECWQRFEGPTLLILSGRDLTAEEFKQSVNDDPDWQALLEQPRVTRYDFAAADHTFSSAEWREQVAAWTLSWIKSL